MTTDYTPRPLTIERDAEHPDRYRLTYQATDACPDTETWGAVRWHDAVLALEFQRPSLRREAENAPHPAIVGILDDVRGGAEIGVAAYTIAAEARPVAGITPRPKPAQS